MDLFKKIAGVKPPNGGGVQFVGSATAVGLATDYTISLTSLTGGIGSTALEDDFVVLCFAEGVELSQLGVTESGWKQVSDLGTSTPISYDGSQMVMVKFMGAVPETTVNIISSAATNAKACIAMVFRGVDKLTPLKNNTVRATATTDFITNATIPTPPTITPIVEGTMIMCCGSSFNPDHPSSFSSTQLSDFVSVSQDGGTTDVTVGAGLYKDWASGAFAPSAFNYTHSSNANGGWIACTLTLIPDQSAVRKITFVGGNNATQAGVSTSLPLSLTALVDGSDSSPQEGDIVIVCTMTRYSSSSIGQVQEAGWTLIASEFNTIGEDIQFRVYYKIMGATPDTVVTMNHNRSDMCAIVATVYRGVDNTTPFHIAATSLLQLGVNDPLIQDITTTDGDALIVAGAFNTDSNGFDDLRWDTTSVGAASKLVASSEFELIDINPIAGILGAVYQFGVAGLFSHGNILWSNGSAASETSVSFRLALKPA